MSAAAGDVPEVPRAPMPRQRSKPLLPIRGVVSLIDRNEDAVLALIEQGQIAWAWDVSLDGKRARSKELRVLPAAVANYMTGRPCTLEWADVLGMLIPADARTLATPEVSRLLNASHTHVFALGGRKLLRHCSSWRTGPGGAARFSTESVVNFLRNRRFP